MQSNDGAHFWISFVTLVGGGFLAYSSPELKDMVVPAITTVVGFWFGAKAANGNGKGNGV